MTTKWFDRANALLEGRGVTRVTVGEALGQSPQSASLKLSGKRPTTVDEIAIIARLAGVSVSELVFDDESFVRSLEEEEWLKLFRMLSVNDRAMFFDLIRSRVSQP